jgi:hypothetical protein
MAVEVGEWIARAVNGVVLQEVVYMAIYKYPSWTSWVSSSFVSEALALPASPTGLKLLSLRQLLALCMYDAAGLLGCGLGASSLFLRGGRVIRGIFPKRNGRFAQSVSDFDT